MGIVKASLVYYSQTRYGMTQCSYMSGALFDMASLPKAVRQKKGVNKVTILGGLDNKGAFVPLAVEQYSGWNYDDGLFCEVKHLPLPLTLKDPYRKGLLAEIECNLKADSVRAALSA